MSLSLFSGAFFCWNITKNTLVYGENKIYVTHTVFYSGLIREYVPVPQQSAG